jgi:transcription initiation factor TFIID TATA-box-binding protein
MAIGLSRAKVQTEIVNVVASASVDQRIELNAIVRAFPNIEYRPEIFPGLVFKLKKPKTATLIFSSGKMVCTGAKSEEGAKRAVRLVVAELKNGGIPIVGKPKISIQNIVAYVRLGGDIDLERAVFVLGRSMYEPEQFPGMVYRMDVPKVVILIFSNGKLVVAGAKKEEEIHQAVINLQGKLEMDDLIHYAESS